MAATAKINTEYAVRTILFGLMLSGFGGWSLYDGIFGYPEHNRRALKYRELEETAMQSGQPRQVWITWEKVCKDEGWKSEKPGAAKSDWDIRTQFIMTLLFMPWGLGSIIGLACKFRRQFSADDLGLHGFLAEPIAYAAIDRLDKKKWDKKGIVRIDVTVAGKARRLTMDDWHFRGMAAILAEIEKQRPDLVPPAPATPPAEPPADPSAPAK